MNFTNRTRARGGVVAATVTALMLLAPPALAASSTQQTDHSSFNPIGAVFTCLGGDITVTGGTVNQVMHFGQDHQGVFHYTGTITLSGITATDAAGRSYTITGATWFGGKALSETQNLVATDTAHFVIHHTSGGIYGKVQAVSHFTLNGRTFLFDIGTCEPPQD